jgi:hypothetical protein
MDEKNGPGRGATGAESQVEVDEKNQRDNPYSIATENSTAGLTVAVENAIRGVLGQHGPSAFAAPQEAAVAHEAGHAVVATHEGLVIESLSVFSRQEIWTGWCACDGPAWTTGPDTSAANDLSAARVIVAGLAGEAICGLDRPGSSLDELALSQLVGLNAATKLADPALGDAAYDTFAKRLWHEEVWDLTLTILRDHREPFMRLAELLHERRQIRGGKLRRVLAPIRRNAP